MHDLASKRVAVCLASGYFGFFAHTGFVTALSRMGVRPAAISGASAGALVGGMWAAGMDPAQIRETILGIGILDLVDPPRPWDMRGRPGGLVRGRKMERRLERILPAATFEECPTPLSVTAFDLTHRRLHVFDSGPLAPAIRASCALPGMFEPASMDGVLYWDGGTVEKTPMRPLAERGVETIVVCYLAHTYEPGPPASIAGGLRAALHTLIYPEQQRVADELRARGLEILVIAPRVPASGPGKLSRGPAIIEAAISETQRILESGDLGCDELM